MPCAWVTATSSGSMRLPSFGANDIACTPVCVLQSCSLRSPWRIVLVVAA